MILASFVNRVGNGLFNTASALYFTLVVDLPAVQVGAALTVAGLIGLLAGIPGGHLADRRGPRTIMMLALTVQAVAMSALVLVESWAALTVIATVDRLAAAAGGAAWGALVVRVGTDRPALFRAKLRTYVNLGVVLGTVGAGFAVAAIFVHSLGEIWESSAGFALGFGLAPDHAQGQYQGLLGLGFSAGQALAPAILTTVVLGLGTAGWLLLGAFFAAVGAVGPSLERWGTRTRSRQGAAAAEPSGEPGKAHA
ncbi:hypothetical protein OG808_41570 [Streptomyces sp. NBC_01761]|uniref:MFS transporter n=1 Tax=Streptomyces sp. NBC_01761 TaxID=2975932 RepID=UPI002DD9F5EA|nr:MFS transporter [Streptomyces sp. NBC_01761]WSC58181.1 hypothetical protein OG808_41570 [Streptomyces sp. NBC_01761]